MSDLSSMSPSDATVALRSFPRRYREALAAVDETENLDRLVTRRGLGGQSVLELVVNTARSLSMLDRALEQVLTAEVPVLHVAVVHRAARQFDLGPHEELADVMAELGRAAEAFADRASRVAADDWARPAEIAGGGTVTALEIVQEAVTTGVDNLREAESVLSALRGG